MLRDFVEDLDRPGFSPNVNSDPEVVRIALYGRALGQAGTEEVIRCLRNPPNVQASIIQSKRASFHYWQIVIDGAVGYELVSLPPSGLSDASLSLPSAAETPLVQAAKLLPRSRFQELIDNGGLLSVGRSSIDVASVISAIGLCSDAHGNDTAFSGQYTTIEIDGSITTDIGPSKSLSNFRQCYLASPLKYQFLEVYRSVEILFLYSILKKINSDFFGNPSAAVKTASDALVSELAQFADLSASAETAFEIIYDLTSSLKSSNSLAAAVVDKVIQQKGALNSKAKKGSGVIYFIRCAIVHAGDKDLVFESFSDAEDLLRKVLPAVEIASLKMCGVTMS